MSGTDRMTMHDAHPVDDLPAFVLEDLSPSDMRAVAAHVRACAQCQHELAELQAAFVTATEELPPERPGAHVLDAVHARIGRNAKGRPPARRQAARGDAGTGRRAAGTGRPRWASAFAVAVVLVVGLGAWGLMERQAARLAEGRLAEAQRALTEARARVEALEADRTTLARWLARPQLVVQQVPAEDTADVDSFAHGSMLMLPDGRTLVVMREPPGPDRDYQAWGLRGNEVTSLGVFAGHTIEVSSGDYDSVAVSLEPPGGSETPTDVLGAVPTG